VTNERVLRELSLPPDGETRLCYFAIPTALISYYRDVVFASVERIGLVPAAGDEVDPWLGDVQGLRDALLHRAHAVVGDVSSGDPRVINDLRAAAQLRQPPRIAVVRNDDQPVDHFAPATPRYFGRPRPPDNVWHWPTKSNENEDDWLRGLLDWLAEDRAESPSRLEDEASRFLTSPDYRAAVIAALSAFEVALREHLERHWESIQKSYRLQALEFDWLIQSARTLRLLQPDEEQTLHELQQLRNRAIHTRDDIDGRRAAPLVKRAIEIAERLRQT
jgi:hypothetical protein